MTVVIAVDKGILPRICSDEIKGDGIVKDVFAEEYLVPSKKQYILRIQTFHEDVLKFRHIENSRCLHIVLDFLLPGNIAAGEKF